MFKFSLKFLKLIFIIFYYLITSIAINLFYRDRIKRLIKLAENLSVISKIALRNFGITVRLKNKNQVDLSENHLILCNHLSYLDILIICSVLPSTFITSFEVKDTKFLGGLSRAAGSIFVDRRDPVNLRNEISHIKDLISGGIQVVIFPEATSSNGETVLPFKSGLIECIMGSGRQILLLSLNYKLVNNSPVNDENRDLLYWYGDMSFFPHLLSLLKLDSILAEINILDILNPEDFSSRKEISAKAYSTVKTAYIQNKNQDETTAISSF